MAKTSPQIKSFSERGSALRQSRNLKIAESAHAYVRGNTLKFYEWLAASDRRSKVPQGPPIWICGDCHVGNLGPLADTDGEIDIEIRDLDQTVIGNPAHDLIRLGLSFDRAREVQYRQDLAEERCRGRFIDQPGQAHCRVS